MSTAATPLSDLTDVEILELTQKIKSDEAEKSPLVAATEPLSILLEEYAGAETYCGKIKNLQRDWRFVRRVRGDGDCFYRAFCFAFIESLTTVGLAQAAIARFESLLPLLDRVGFSKDIYEDFYEPLGTLLACCASSTGLSADKLLLDFNDPEISNSIVVFIRLLTSAFLQANEDDYIPFLFSLEDDPRFFGGETPTLQQFCGFFVEPVSKEADHIQIAALTRALGINLSIAYLDQSGAIGGAANLAGTEVDFHEFEENSQKKLGCALLYRPGHYDCLYR